MRRNEVRQLPREAQNTAQWFKIRRHKANQWLWFISKCWCESWTLLYFFCISEVHYQARHLSYLLPSFNSITQLIRSMPVACPFVPALPQTPFTPPVSSEWLSVLTYPLREKKLGGIHWREDNLGSRASAPAAGKLLNEPITANTHFPDWIQRKPTFLESPILPLSQHSFRSSKFSLFGPAVVQSSINKEGVKLIPEPDAAWKDPAALNQDVVLTEAALATGYGLKCTVKSTCLAFCSSRLTAGDTMQTLNGRKGRHHLAVAELNWQKGNVSSVYRNLLR